jgi:hypothetical protein
VTVRGKPYLTPARATITAAASNYGALLEDHPMSHWAYEIAHQSSRGLSGHLLKTGMQDAISSYHRQPGERSWRVQRHKDGESSLHPLNRRFSTDQTPSTERDEK